VLGRSVTGISAAELTALRRENLGFIFQNFNRFPTLSAEDNIALSLATRGVPLRQAAARALAAGLNPARLHTLKEQVA
jgi:putative ABC transport system ATP-binding protein